MLSGSHVNIHCVPLNSQTQVFTKEKTRVRIKITFKKKVKYYIKDESKSDLDSIVRS